MKRNFKREYELFHSKPEERAKRSSRNKARRKLKSLGRAISGLDVDHKNGNPLDNSAKNLQAIPKSKNRSKK
jgi:hypothetical protein